MSISTSNRSILSAVAIAGALAVGSATAAAAPAVTTNQSLADGIVTAQNTNTSDPTAFSEIAHEQSAQNHATTQQTQPVAPSENTSSRITDPTAFGAMAHDGADSNADRRDQSVQHNTPTHPVDANRRQQPNQAWAS